MAFPAVCWFGGWGTNFIWNHNNCWTECVTLCCPGTGWPCPEYSGPSCVALLLSWHRVALPWVQSSFLCYFGAVLVQGGPVLSTFILPASSESTVTFTSTLPVRYSNAYSTEPNKVKNSLYMQSSENKLLSKVLSNKQKQWNGPQAHLPATALLSSCRLRLGTPSLKSQRALCQEARKQPSHLSGQHFPSTLLIQIVFSMLDLWGLSVPTIVMDLSLMSLTLLPMGVWDSPNYLQNCLPS